MKKIIHIISLLLLIVFLSCENPVAVNAKLNQEFTLNVGQNAELQNEFLRIKFVAVTEDSRCPSDFLCDWAGNAKVAITIQKNKDLTVKDTLNTYSYPQINWSVGYQIKLVKLEPYPKNYETIPQSEYVATFVIKNILPD